MMRQCRRLSAVIAAFVFIMSGDVQTTKTVMVSAKMVPDGSEQILLNQQF